MPTGWAPAAASALLNTLNTGGENGQLHTGDPGAAGTASPSALTTREVITHSTSSAGSPLALTSVPTWSMTATETLAFLSVWDDSSVFRYSVPLAVAQAVNAGDTVILDALDIVLGPVAAD